MHWGKYCDFSQISLFFLRILTHCDGGGCLVHMVILRSWWHHTVPFPSLAKIEKSWALWKTSSCLSTWQTALAQDLTVLARSQLVPPTPKRTKGTPPACTLPTSWIYYFWFLSDLDLIRYIRNTNPKIKNWFKYSCTKHRLQKHALITIL